MNNFPEFAFIAHVGLERICNLPRRKGVSIDPALNIKIRSTEAKEVVFAGSASVCEDEAIFTLYSVEKSAIIITTHESSGNELVLG
jgi:hypothetical protein